VSLLVNHSHKANPYRDTTGLTSDPSGSTSATG
jgi:hypothetical protein